MARKNTLESEQLTDTTYYILLCLVEPSHGYALMGKIQEISSGTFVVGPASMYTNLKRLLDADMIEMVDIDKKVYRLTQKGRVLLQSEYDRRYNIVLQSKKLIKQLRSDLSE